ncbi:hypothetical protein NT07LI_3573, partial [Listeria innocua FSL S4-378]
LLCFVFLTGSLAGFIVAVMFVFSVAGKMSSIRSS